MREAENKVIIEGILSEVDLKHGSYVKDNKTVEYVGGQIKVRVEQKIGGEDKVLEIPVQMFSTKLTKKGQPNPGYSAIEKIMSEFTSIAAGGMEKADYVRVTGARLNQNEYYREDTLISYTRIQGSFVNKVKKEDFAPKATFSTEFVVANMTNEVDKDAVETGRLVIDGIIPGYQDSIQVIKFIAENPKAIEAITQLWQQGDTVKCAGKLNFSSTVQTTVREVEFGEPIEESKTVSVSELIITSGASPLEGEYAYDIDDINKGVAARKEALEASKNKAKKAPAPKATVSAGLTDLGF